MATDRGKEVKKIMRKLEDYWYDEREEENDSLDFYERSKFAKDKINLKRGA
ncbi:MAG: hypothetical protein JSW73_04410 [Candidatus Woesearchaeota archaeon]|nr:MAG: hypothetical protein JSW73_04410 [Candidatus Woesearchaeota archaeon]